MRFLRLLAVVLVSLLIFSGGLSYTAQAQIPPPPVPSATGPIPTLKTPPPAPTPTVITSTAKAIKTPLPSPAPTPLPPLRSFNAPPTLTALAAIAVDADTGRILYVKNPFLHLPEASTTKIMTALTLLAIPGVNINDYTTVQTADLVGEANMDLHRGMRIRVTDLLYGLLLDSANDAAMTLARYGGDKLPGFGDGVTKFVAQMNRQADKLGLYDTHFKNPHGLDEPGHFTSVQDLAVAGWYALQNPIISTIVRQNMGQLDGYWFANISNFIRRYPGANGIKPGQTDDAGLCLVASASRFGHNVIVVELNDPNLATESDLLMDYSFDQLLGQEQSLNSFAMPNQNYIGYPTAAKQLQPTSYTILRSLIYAVFERGVAAFNPDY